MLFLQSSIKIQRPVATPVSEHQLKDQHQWQARILIEVLDSVIFLILILQILQLQKLADNQSEKKDRYIDLASRVFCESLTKRLAGFTDIINEIVVFVCYRE